MYTPSLEKNHSGPCAPTLAEAERSMVRLPLILEILGQLHASTIPQPGDADLRHGCQRALTAMLAALSRIDLATAPAPLLICGKSAREWIHSPEAARLIDADQLERFEQFLSRIPPPCGRHP